MERSTVTALLVLATAVSGAVLVLLVAASFSAAPPPARVMWPAGVLVVVCGAGLVLHRSQR
ncbi:hypothetical protein AB2L27_17205 [Kineococcus sp. LSe6-4]|uniref:Secreted protein with PEP-CTERM sorting signal n=1 Tax=Kineococcus halophytocola TaxID=3234027 RepID=A0ABV4H4J9_9ACTN